MPDGRGNDRAAGVDVPPADSMLEPVSRGAGLLRLTQPNFGGRRSSTTIGTTAADTTENTPKALM